MRHATVLKVTATIVALLFLAGNTCALAEDAPVSKILSGTEHVMNYYNNFGVCYSSTSVSKTTTQTTFNGQTSTTVSESTQVSQWCNGSVQPISIKGTSTTTDSTGKVTSTSNSTTNYTYNFFGVLTGASGSTHTSGTLPNDGGTFEADTVDMYTIKYGQALRTQSVTEQTTTVGGQEAQTSKTTTYYDYQLIGGAMRLMSETSVAHSDSKDGSYSDSTTTLSYNRDANGVCTGMSQTKTAFEHRVNTAGGYTDRTLDSNAYKANFEFDPNVGWHIVSDDEQWTEEIVSA